MDTKQTIRMNPGAGEASYARNSMIQHRNIDSFLPLVTTNIVPGSFYGRLFTTGSVHLFLSSSSLHWLSQAPEDLVNNGIPMYHTDKKLWQQMHPVVLGSYARKFRKDFMMFLESRAQEMVPGGKMVLCFKMTHANEEFTQMWELVARFLAEMASRGVLDEEKLKTFYIPLYAPHEEEVKEIIEEQDSFSITGRLQVHDSMIGVNKDLVNPKTTAYGIRACFEPIIVEHFGSSGEIADEFVRTVEQHMMNPDNFQQELANKAFLAFCLAIQS